MYQNLKKRFLYPNIKKDIIEYVAKCIKCEQVKIEHQRSSGIIQPLEIPEQKWESISMNFIIGLPPHA